MTNDKDSAVTQADVDAYWDMMDCDGHPPDASSEGFEPCMGMIAFADHRTAERERCAQIAENIIGANQYDTMDTDCYQDTADRIAAAIRNNSPMPYGEAVAYLLKHGKKWEQLK